MADEDAMAALLTLADIIGVDLSDVSMAVATKEKDAKARLYDGSLEANISTLRSGMVKVGSPRNPSVMIKLVDHQKDPTVPEGAIYEILALMPTPEGVPNVLNGDVYSVYVGRQGIIIPGRD